MYIFFSGTPIKIMCVSLRVSLIAGTIGEVCAYILLKRGDTELAALLATFSLMQFYEAISYVQNKTPRFPIGALLAAQGVAFFTTLLYQNPTDPTVRISNGLCVLILVMILLVKEPFSTHCGYGCRWEMGSDTWHLIRVMYAILYSYFFLNPQYHVFAYVTLSALVVTLTLFKDGLSPSWWCLTSALASPLYIALTRLPDSG